MNYNKKQMKPLIDKFQINPETNKLFMNIIEMFDDQPNYQIWAVKAVFSKAIDYEALTKIHDWAELNQTMIKNLEKKNIVSYSNKTQFSQLFREMKALDSVSIIKDVISHFNTDQRKMLMDSILPGEINGLEASESKAIKAWGKIFEKFNKLPSFRKNNFYTKASGIRNLEDLQNLIKEALNATYTWNKEDFMAYLENNAKSCEVVFNKDNYVIVRIPNFEMSKKLCGGGRTQWCITMESRHWNDYVAFTEDRTQYFLFDFNRRETDPFAHIGFTIEKGNGIVEAQTCDNERMMNDFSNGVETFNIHTALKNVGVKKGTFVQLPTNSDFKWNMESMLKFVKENPSYFAVAFEKDNRVVINVLTMEGLRRLLSHTMINVYNLYMDANLKTYVVMDFNLEVNDDNAVMVLSYAKDAYGDYTLRTFVDLFNSDMKGSKYFSEIGLSSNDFLNREAIDPSILLHKLIDETDELGAIKLIEKEGKNINVNYEFNERKPIFGVLNNKIFKLFEIMIQHPTFDPKTEDGFGETLLEALLYMYGADAISTSANDEEYLKKTIDVILKANNFDFNSRDLNDDTPLLIACDYKKMDWVAKELIAKKSVDVNAENSFGATPLSTCIANNNLELIAELGKRPDLIVRPKDKKLAAQESINLHELIKPDTNIFTTHEEYSMASLLSELESAATVMS